MIDFVSRFLVTHQTTNNYRLFLAALVLLTIFPLINALFPSYSHQFFRLTYSLVIILGTYTVTRSLTKLSFGAVLGFITIASYWGTELAPIGETQFNMIPNFLGISFFSFIGVQLYHSIKSYQSVDTNVIYGTIIGYLILGIIGGQSCIFLDQIVPGSFESVDVEASPYQYYYFSFVCLTTVGFGDITPITDAGRSLALLISLIGQVYLTVVIALIIGKFISQKTQV